jgi:tetratricopeptide (TPR) repeat protein
MPGVHFLGGDTIIRSPVRDERRHADDVETYEGDDMDLDAFRQMVAKHPNGFLGRYGLGNKLLQDGGNLDEAVEHLQAAVRLDPVHVASHLALGKALIALGRNEEAKPVLRAGIDAALSGRSNGGGDLVPEMRALVQTLG